MGRGAGAQEGAAEEIAEQALPAAVALSPSAPPAPEPSREEVLARFGRLRNPSSGVSDGVRKRAHVSYLALTAGTPLAYVLSRWQNQQSGSCMFGSSHLCSKAGMCGFEHPLDSEPALVGADNALPHNQHAAQEHALPPLGESKSHKWRRLQKKREQRRAQKPQSAPALQPAPAADPASQPLSSSGALPVFPLAPASAASPIPPPAPSSSAPPAALHNAEQQLEQTLAQIDQAKLELVKMRQERHAEEQRLARLARQVVFQPQRQQWQTEQARQQLLQHQQHQWELQQQWFQQQGAWQQWAQQPSGQQHLHATPLQSQGHSMPIFFGHQLPAGASPQQWQHWQHWQHWQYLQQQQQQQQQQQHQQNQNQNQA